MKNVIKWVVFLTLISVEALAQDYESYFYYDTATARDRVSYLYHYLQEKTFECPELFPVKVIFESGSIYRDDDPTKSKIDPVKKAAYDAEVKLIADFMKTLTQTADLYLKTPGPNYDIADCVVSHATSWIKGGAMLGEHKNTVGYHKSADLLRTISLALSKISEYGYHLTPEDRAWLIQISDNVLDYYSEDGVGPYGLKAGPKTQRNNHRYWDGFAVASAVILLNDDAYLDYFHWGLEALSIGLDEIDNDGTLPLEIARASKAWSYHLYAVKPLMALAEIAANNGDKMESYYYPYNRNDKALVRLGDLLVSQSLQPTLSAFNNAGEMSCSESAWLDVYAKRNLSRTKIKTDLVQLILDQRRRCNNKAYYTGLGGDVRATFGLSDSGLSKLLPVSP